MKKSLYSLPQARNKVHLEPFDFSQNRMQSFMPGMIHVLQCIECLPGEKFRINVSSLTRTLPLNSAAIVRGKEHFNFHFVPTRLLWRYFPDFVIQNSHSDSAQDIINASVPSVCPSVSLAELRAGLGTLYTNSTKDIFNRPICYSINKLAQQLGYGNLVSDWENNDPAAHTLLVNIFPFLAYQKIYQDFYRNTQWESYDATTFNVDYLSSLQSNIDCNKLLINFDVSAPGCNLGIFTPRYANYKKDMFFGIRPNSQFGEVSVVSVSTDNGTLSGGGNKAVALGADGSLSIQGATTSDPRIPVELKGQFDILMLRKAEAIQRLREIQQASDFRYKSQIDRRFGFNVPDSRAQMAEYITGFDNVLQITDVTATASTENGDAGSTLGQLGGKGTMVSSGDKTIDYETKEHGYLVCTYYISHEVNYNAVGVNRNNMHLTFEDFFQPEFQNIGLDSVLMSQLYFDYDIQENPNNPIGYAPRYLEYKTQPDLLLDQFMTGGSLSYWTTPLPWSKIAYYYNNNEQIDWPWFKIPPSAFDDIMLLGYSDDQTTNPFLSTIYFDIKALRPMSVDGMPDWHNV